jgi:hypothetical protein
MRAFAGAPSRRGFRVLGWESTGEIPSEVEGTTKNPGNFSSAMPHQGILPMLLNTNPSPRRGRLVVARRFNGGKGKRNAFFLAPQAARSAAKRSFFKPSRHDRR